MKRALHWALFVSTALFALSLIDALCMPGVHRPAGNSAIAVVLSRAMWGVAQSRPAPCSAVVRMLCVAVLAFTGWLYTTDACWGSEAIEALHRALAWALLALVAWHVMRVIWMRAKRRG